MGGTLIFIGILRTRTYDTYGVKHGNANIVCAAKETNAIIGSFHGVRSVYGNEPRHGDYAVHFNDTVYLDNAACRILAVDLDDMVHFDNAVRSDCLQKDAFVLVTYRTRHIIPGMEVIAYPVFRRLNRIEIT